MSCHPTLLNIWTEIALDTGAFTPFEPVVIVCFSLPLVAVRHDLQSRPFLFGPPCPLSMLVHYFTVFWVPVNVERGDGGENDHCQWEGYREWFM